MIFFKCTKPIPKEASLSSPHNTDYHCDNMVNIISKDRQESLTLCSNDLYNNNNYEDKCRWKEKVEINDRDRTNTSSKET